MTMVAEISWDDMAAPDFGNPARAAWREAVAQVADKARATLPECTGRVDRAVMLVLAGDVELLKDGTARVGSQSDGRTQYVVCNGTCPCKDFAAAPHALCKHRLGAAIARRALVLLQVQENGQAAPVPSPVEPAPPAPVVALPGSSPGQALPESLLPYVVHIKGKAFVQYAGLLALAHQRGLVSLTAKFISVTAELALAEATAAFANGTHFAEAADATPGNVGKQVSLHYARMALTRAKSRVLRDALAIPMTAIEELED